jgi:hypothetical protein
MQNVIVAKRKHAIEAQVNAYAFTPIDASCPALRKALRPRIVQALYTVSNYMVEYDEVRYIRH